MWEAGLTWTSVATGLVSAALWFWATRIRVVKRHTDIRPEEHGIWLFTDDPDLREQPFLTARWQNRCNAWAAGFTGATVLFQATAMIAHRFGW